MTWGLPPERVAYEGDATAAATLVASGTGYRHPDRPLFHTLDNGPPAGWGPPAYYRPKAIEQLIGNPARIPDGILFMHGRRAASGPVRLLVVTVGSTEVYPDGTHHVGCGASVFEPASWTAGSVVSRKLSPLALREHYVLLPVWGKLRLCVFAGQPDPLDASRFTIRFDLDGKEGTIEGRLGDDDGVTFVVRNGPPPLVRRSPSSLGGS
jgi:hypothetical protein